jgi:hypothetical protein
MRLFASMNVKPGVSTLAHALSKELLRNYITIMVLHSHPFSRGSIHVGSASNDDKPIYDPECLSHTLGLEIFARHTQFLDKIAVTEAFASLLKPKLVYLRRLSIS